MLSRRIIPCLDVRDGRVVKGVRFRDHVDMGDIVELALRYRDAGADGVVVYDCLLYTSRIACSMHTSSASAWAICLPSWCRISFAHCAMPQA